MQPCILLVIFLLSRREFFAHFQCRVPQRCSNKEHFLMSVRPSFHSIATDFRCHRVDVTFKGRGRFKLSLIRIRKLFFESQNIDVQFMQQIKFCNVSTAVPLMLAQPSASLTAVAIRGRKLIFVRGHPFITFTKFSGFLTPSPLVRFLG